MAKLTTTDLANLTNQTTAVSQINANNTLIEAALENTLSRDGTTPNTMSASLDMNSQSILNVATIEATTITLDGISILTSLPSVTPRGAWVTATAYVVGDLISNGGITYICNTAHTSGTFSTDNTSGYWTVFASLSATVQTPERFSGDDADTTKVLSVAPTNEDYILVFIDGVYQNHDQYSISGATITFSTAPPTGTDNIEVYYTVGTTTFAPGTGSVDGATLAASIDASTTPSVWTNVDINSGAIDGTTVGATSASTGAFTTMTGTDLTLSGDLTVNGTTVSLQITNQVSADPLIELNNGAASNANDMGVIMERGSTGDNAFMGWDESADHFIMATTTATGSSTGNISYTAADLTVAAITATSGTLAGLTSLAMSAGATLTAGFLDEDTMSSNSAVAGVTQQSVKAYVDSKIPAAGIQMTWESLTTDTDQGAGKVWANNGTFASITVLYFDDVENNSVSINSLIDSLDDPTATNSATIYIQESGDAGAGMVFQVNGAVTSASTYSKVAVSPIATWGTMTDADIIGVTFAFSGNNGAGAGDLVAANNLSDVANAATSFGNIKQAASATATGVVELATDAELNTGTDTTRAVTPANVEAWTGSTNITSVGTITAGTWTGTDVAVADGGTGSSTAGGARTNLGLVIGTDVLAEADTPIGQHTIFVPASAMEPAVTTAAASSNAVEIGTSLFAARTMDFATDADNFAYFGIQLPKSWNAGTLLCQFVWSATGTTGNTVLWAIAAVALGDEEVLTTAFPTPTSPAADTNSTTADDLMISAEVAVTVDSTPAAENYVMFEVSRDVSGDTLAEDARLHGIRIHYTTDTGSDT